jgi:DNA-binding phage protein
MFWLVVDGRKTSIRTRLSHGAAEYGGNLLALIARQVGLSRQELYRLVDCPMDGEKLKRLLVERGKLRP